MDCNDKYEDAFWLSLLTKEDKDIRIKICYENFKTKNDVIGLLSDDSLGEFLRTGEHHLQTEQKPMSINNFLQSDTGYMLEDPFAKKDGDLSPVGRLFLSSYWDQLLSLIVSCKEARTCFVQARLVGFRKEIGEYYDAVRDDCFERFCHFAISTSVCGLNNIRSENWYDIPPMLRIIATTHTKICESDADAVNFYCQCSLKGLPPKVLMLPFETYKLRDFSGAPIDAQAVSKKICLKSLCTQSILD